MPFDVPDKRKRLFKNSLYGLFSWLFPILPTIVVTPVIVRGVGNEQYGLYVVIIGFISYFFTTGIGKVAAKYVAEYTATGENDKISAIISSTVLLSLSICLAGTAVVVVFARVIVVDVLLIPANLQNDAVTGLYLACATIVSITLGQIFQFVLQGLQRFDRYLLITNLSALLAGVGGIVLVLNGFGVIALLYLNLFTATVIGLVSIFLAVKLLPEFKFSLSIDRETWRAVTRYAASIIAYQTFGNILLLFERGWIMRRFGPEALAFYAVPMALAMYVHLFTASLVLGLFPMVNELLAERAKLVVLYQKSTKLILTLVVFAVISVVASGASVSRSVAERRIRRRFVPFARDSRIYIRFACGQRDRLADRRELSRRRSQCVCDLCVDGRRHSADDNFVWRMADGGRRRGQADRRFCLHSIDFVCRTAISRRYFLAILGIYRHTDRICGNFGVFGRVSDRLRDGPQLAHVHLRHNCRIFNLF